MTKHVRTEGGVEKYHEPIGAPIVLHPKVPLKKAEPGYKTTFVSGDRAQRIAQTKAEMWYETKKREYDEGFGDPVTRADAMSAEFWQEYQNPVIYGKINSVLRGTPDPTGPSKADLAAMARRMFDEAGYQLPENVSLYRGLRTMKSIDWKNELTPGSIFTDKGMVSTTAQENFAQGWLTIGLHGEFNSKSPLPDDVVMEIHVPKGTRVVGGSPNFIETMLPPGSKFRIISNETRYANATDPLETSRKIPPFPYTHIVAELIP
jgi:hypothetical protein